jgi:hypothetical protein
MVRGYDQSYYKKCATGGRSIKTKDTFRRNPKKKIDVHVTVR